MHYVLTTVAIRFEHDVVLARQRARQIAQLIGFDSHDQVRIATSVSEIARNAFRYAGGGKVEFALTRAAPFLFQVKITDSGPGIPHLQAVLDGAYVSPTGMGLGIVGARRLMDQFEVTSEPGKGTSVVLGKHMPRSIAPPASSQLAEVARQLAQAPPQDPFEEIQRQNQELLATIDQVQRQKAELSELNKELEDTNRGVVALYAELDERADYLRRASELKTQFLSNMTHEFRTPLNSILSIARILGDQADGPLNPEQDKQVKFIQKAANDLSELVNDMLDLAKVEAGKVTIRPSEFSVENLFRALRGMLRPLSLTNSSVTLIFDDPGDLPPILSDESKISQILRNLVSNALKFTDSGEVRVSAGREGREILVISVVDTGIGIAEADHERIFEEFIQVEGEHQKGKRGTGLGLPLSRKLARLLGGTLTVTSEPGVGSNFTLRIPFEYAGPGVANLVPELPAELDPKRRPILVVEDNRETHYIYEKFLKDTPFQTVPARTISEAQVALKRFRPVAIILDILLAHESAWAFLTEVKSNKNTEATPVVVVTMLDNEQKAIALGADAFHSKPIDRSWLLQQLQQLTQPPPPQEVLIIDDDAASRYVLTSFLHKTPFQVIEAPDGRRGLELARARRPSLIFLDLKMQDMSGFQVLKALRQAPETRSIPVVIHTSKQLTETDRKKLEGVVGIIPKNHDNRQDSDRLIFEALSHAHPPEATPAIAYAAKT